MTTTQDIVDITPTEISIDQQKEINYKIWKKNSPILYDFLLTNPLDWPSLTLQWFPDIDNSIDNVISQRLLLSSYSSGYNKFENLKLYQFKKSNYSINNDLNIFNDFNDIKNEFITSKNPSNLTNFSLLQKIPHTGDINKSKYMPQNPNLISTTSNTGDILIFDRTKKPNSYDNTLISNDNDDITLKFHTTETWGLDWNKFKQGELISGSNDGLLAIWDINKFKKSTKTLSPISTLPLHSMAINCLQYSYFNSNLIGTVGDDTFFKLIDSRNLINDPIINIKNPLKNAFTCLDFNPFNQFGLTISDVKGNLFLFDLRSMENPINIIRNAHNDSITSLKWNPEFGSILLTTSSDSTAKLWNFNKSLNNESIFTHGGHLFSVNDADWNPNDSTMVASCSDDNSVQIWKPSSYIFN